MFFKRKNESLKIIDSQSDFAPDNPKSVYDFAQALADMEETFRPFRTRPHKRDWVKSPIWLTKADGLHAVMSKQSEIRKSGKIVYSALVQANSALFSSGRGNAPGNMLYSHNPYYASHPFELESLASNLFAFKGLSNETIQAIADILENELDRNLYSELPLEYASGRKVIMTGTLFEREHLPSGFIQTSIMPMLVSPWAPECIMLPVHYWPPSLIKALKRGDMSQTNTIEFG